MNINPDRSERIAKLLASTSSDTVYIPLSKLKRNNKLRYKNNSLIRSSSLLSNDEIASQGSLTSEFSLSSLGENSLRERIRKMEEKIKEHQEDGLIDLNSSPSLPAEIFSWNRRIPKRYQGLNNISPQRPPVNIIGCHQPPELIFARADERIRKQLHAKELKEKHLEELVKYLDHLIQMKLTRGERYAAQLEQQQRHSSWLKVFHILRYASLVLPIIQASKTTQTQNKQLEKAAKTIQVRLVNWYERKILLRYSNFVSQIVDVVWKFRLHVAIFQKRRACRIIRTFLQEKRENREVVQLVHSFIAGVRKIQATARNFIACKLSRIRALCALWEDLETQYIQTILASRKHEMNTQNSRSMKNLVIDEKTRIEMDKQNSKWEVTDKKFAKMLEGYRKSGQLNNAVENANIENLKLPSNIRFHICAQLVATKRREHIQSMNEMQKKLSNSLQFSVEDAAALVKGIKMPSVKLNTDSTSHKILTTFMPFNLFSVISDQEILEKIKEHHKAADTFRVRGEEVALLRLKKIPVEISKPGYIIRRQSSIREESIQN